MSFYKPALLIALNMLLSAIPIFANDLCLEGICIGDDIYSLNVQWKEVSVNYYDEKFTETELKERSAKDVYQDYNELIIADNKVLTNLLPYVIRKQLFDKSVLKELSNVKAFCSSLTMTGEVIRQSNSRLFVTFRAVTNKGGKGKLRVFKLEKQFNILAPHIRPKDATLFNNVKAELLKTFPDLKVVRDIDGRHGNLDIVTATAVLGFRFVSDVTNPLILRLTDDQNIPLIEEDNKNSNSLCRLN